MNAKEMCKQVEEEKIKFFIDKMINCNGVYSNAPISIERFETNFNFKYYFKSSEPSPSPEVIILLVKKGYKVVEFEQEFPINFTPLYKTVEKESGFWIFKKKKQVKVFDKYEPVMQLFKWIEISACCGEK